MALQWQQCLPLHMQHGFFELTWVIRYFELTFCRIFINEFGETPRENLKFP